MGFLSSIDFIHCRMIRLSLIICDLLSIRRSITNDNPFFTTILRQKVFFLISLEGCVVRKFNYQKRLPYLKDGIQISL